MPVLTAEVAGRSARVARLARLSEKLESNRRVLDVQLRAVREVADIIAATIRDAEFGRHLFDVLRLVMKVVLIGIWVVVVALGATWGGAVYWPSRTKVRRGRPVR